LSDQARGMSREPPSNRQAAKEARLRRPDVRWLAPLLLVPVGISGKAVADGIAGAHRAAKPACPRTSAPTVVSPLPGTPDASPTSQVSVLGPTPCQIVGVTVVGSKSGKQILTGHQGAYSTGDGASFFPRRPFTPGEQVQLYVDRNNGGRRSRVAYSFTVAVPAAPTSPPTPATAVSPTLNSHSYVSRPDLHPTTVAVTTAAAGLAPGYLFLAPVRGPGPPGPMFGQYGPLIVDNHGDPVWSQPTPPGTEAFDFRAQTLNGKPVLTWFQGRLSAQGVGYGEYVILDSAYHRIGVVRAGNGYQGDLHEFILTSRGTALMTSDATVVRDLRPYGGPVNGTLHDSIVQEVDIKTGRVMWEWHSLGHIALADSYAPAQPNVTWDPYHVNSIQPLSTGDILISQRNTWAGYDLRKTDGQILWRIGGKKSRFALAPGVQFAWQHDIEMHAGDTLSVFDNEAGPPSQAPQSRAELIKLDFAHKTASLVAQYTHPTPLLASSQGKTQPLANGNVLVGWGAQNFLSEFSGSGQLLFDAQFVAPVESYRAYRIDWTGRPTTLPTAVAKAAGAGAVTVYASWNGATEVASWRVLSGSAANALRPAGGPAARTGFETAISSAARGPYLAVQALDEHGRVLATSKAARAA
jgi:Arylsulfotransferase (ASST)